MTSALSPNQERYLRIGLRQSQGWNRPLDLDAAAAAAAKELVTPVALGLMRRGVVTTDYERIAERIRTRVLALLEVKVAQLESEGTAVSGLAGSAERALEALLADLGSPEGT